MIKTFVKSNLAPNYFVEKVSDIKIKDLDDKKLMLFDLDATLVNHGSMKIDDEVVSYMKSLAIPFAIATNRQAPKGDLLGKLLGAKDVFHATKSYRKPQKHYFNNICSKTGLKPNQIVMVGDRLFSDIYGANRAGLSTIMVRNLGSDPWYIKYFGIRRLEYFILRLVTKLQ